MTDYITLQLGSYRPVSFCSIVMMIWGAAAFPYRKDFWHCCLFLYLSSNLVIKSTNCCIWSTFMYSNIQRTLAMYNFDDCAGPCRKCPYDDPQNSVDFPYNIVKMFMKRLIRVHQYTNVYSVSVISSSLCWPPLSSMLYEWFGLFRRRCIALHLRVLNLSYLLPDHSDTVSPCIIASERSFMKITRNKGPRKLSYGIPRVTSGHLDLLLCCERPSKMLIVLALLLPLIP